MKRRYVTDLGADMQADPSHPQIFVLRGAAAELASVPDGDSELVLAQSGRDIRMRFSRHVRIDAQGYVGDFAQLGGAGCQQLKLAFTFDVEEQDFTAQRQSQLIGCLADSREHYFAERFLVRAANAL